MMAIQSKMKPRTTTSASAPTSIKSDFLPLTRARLKKFPPLLPVVLHLTQPHEAAEAGCLNAGMHACLGVIWRGRCHVSQVHNVICPNGHPSSPSLFGHQGPSHSIYNIHRDSKLLEPVAY